MMQTRYEVRLTIVRIDKIVDISVPREQEIRLHKSVSHDFGAATRMFDWLISNVDRMPKGKKEKVTNETETISE